MATVVSLPAHLKEDLIDLHCDDESSLNLSYDEERDGDSYSGLLDTFNSAQSQGDASERENQRTFGTTPFDSCAYHADNLIDLREDPEASSSTTSSAVTVVSRERLTESSASTSSLSVATAVDVNVLVTRQIIPKMRESLDDDSSATYSIVADDKDRADMFLTVGQSILQARFASGQGISATQHELAVPRELPARGQSFPGYTLARPHAPPGFSDLPVLPARAPPLTPPGFDDNDDDFPCLPTHRLATISQIDPSATPTLHGRQRVPVDHVTASCVTGSKLAQGLDPDPCSQLTGYLNGLTPSDYASARTLIASYSNEPDSPSGVSPQRPCDGSSSPLGLEGVTETWAPTLGVALPRASTVANPISDGREQTQRRQQPPRLQGQPRQGVGRGRRAPPPSATSLIKSPEKPGDGRLTNGETEPTYSSKWVFDEPAVRSPRASALRLDKPGGGEEAKFSIMNKDWLYGDFNGSARYSKRRRVPGKRGGDNQRPDIESSPSASSSNIAYNAVNAEEALPFVEKWMENYEVRFIDTHCHIDFLFKKEKYERSWTSYKERRKTSMPPTYLGCIAIFCDPDTWRKDGDRWDILLNSESNRDIFAAFGVHPHSVDAYTDEVGDELEIRLTHPRVVAAGEMGLDYGPNNSTDHSLQKDVFIKQLEIAKRLGLPIQIHCRDAADDCLQIMKTHLPRDYKIHRNCYTGGPEEMQQWRSYFDNLFFGFTPLVLKDISYLNNAVERLDTNRILLETDAPYFLPTMARSTLTGNLTQNHPGMAIASAVKIAELKGLPVGYLLEQCLKNTEAIYGIRPCGSSSCRAPLANCVAGKFCAPLLR